MYDYNGNETLG